MAIAVDDQILRSDIHQNAPRGGIILGPLEIDFRSTQFEESSSRDLVNLFWRHCLLRRIGHGFRISLNVSIDLDVL